ncbi:MULTISPECIES: type IV pilus modification protein PilV [unclassified Polaromonas]|uniref:type IV pilus modification protein PilV n=1 Tax=unclassified Polaromonas TaxID=2638319 RepID=UPI000F07C0BE|nr:MULTISPECIES: type IV pilus modification protein PilV [unclassified Polaromonas]AYQ29011.1 type IV pilus modification protein PilV [Polaromonas sp. SP1]QGJ20896.1 type IV pilus modification protein PilV [Polaromonas sp. Pch-P]
MPRARSNRNARALRPSRGFSLLEVLISMVILSFGLLGMVGLQASALQSNRQARIQATAGSLAHELAEMMRKNKEVGLLPAADNPYLGHYDPSDVLPSSPSYCLNVAPGATPCSSAAEIANAQLTEWLTRVRAELPNAYVNICVDSAPFDANGMPRFACTGTGAGATTVIKIGWSRLSTDRSATGANAIEQGTVPSLVLPVTPGNST